MDFFIQVVDKIQSDYNFDGVRIDHVDHIVDELSQKNGIPISYRVQSDVLVRLNETI